MLSAVSHLFHATTVDVETLDPNAYWGILVALFGAALLSFGAQYQSRGLNKVERITGESASSGVSFSHVSRLLRRPSWLVGTLLLGAATVFQIGSLSLSPLILVQPIGVVALVITAMLNAKYSNIVLGSKAITAIIMSVVGVSVFVTVAAFTAVDQRVTEHKLGIILILFTIVFLIALALYITMRRRAVALVYIVGTGVIYGFVATLAKTLISRFQQHDFDILTWLTVVALVLGALLGMFFVQNAYSSGPPDLVIAGLTVIDPLVAIVIGITILGEAERATPLAITVFIISGLIAMLGVYRLAKFHPQSGKQALIETTTGRIRIPREGIDR